MLKKSTLASKQLLIMRFSLALSAMLLAFWLLAGCKPIVVEEDYPAYWPYDSPVAVMGDPWPEPLYEPMYVGRFYRQYW